MRGAATFSGELKARVIRARPTAFKTFLRRLNNAWNALQGAGVFYSQLSARHYIAAQDKWIDLGVISRKVVTTVFVNFMVDNMVAETSAWGDFKYHASGTDDTPGPSVSDTALQLEVETPREGGTQLEGATANVYKSVETITYTGTHAIVEHGLFNATTAGTLLDIHTFAAINVVATDQIEFTYELTCQAGG